MTLGDRMKDYEGVPRHRLVRKVPVAGRLDGRAFHTFTRHMERPYDARFHRCMWEAAVALCSEISGCTGAYVQSDEISLVLLDDRTFDTGAWFDYDIQKMCSVSAAVCTAAFLETYREQFGERPRSLPGFDARFFNMPRYEVPNLLLWRQNDASRNSLSSLCQAHYSSRELEGKSAAERHDLLHAKGLNWNDLPTAQKRGVCVVRESYERDGAQRTRWVVDEEIPVFSSDEGKRYLERFIPLPEGVTVP